jgi:hypothetical protein
MVEGPVFVTVDPASTANDAAVPSCTVGCAADATPDSTTIEAITRHAAEEIDITSDRAELRRRPRRFLGGDEPIAERAPANILLVHIVGSPLEHGD